MKKSVLCKVNNYNIMVKYQYKILTLCLGFVHNDPFCKIDIISFCRDICHSRGVKHWTADRWVMDSNAGLYLGRLSFMFRQVVGPF
jgi:hypothetical protein